MKIIIFYKKFGTYTIYEFQISHVSKNNVFFVKRILK